MHNYWSGYNSIMPFGMNLTMDTGGLLLIILIAWSLAWKGVALWKAARKGEKIWFVALLVINTLGILEILYVYVFSERAKPVVEQKH